MQVSTAEFKKGLQDPVRRRAVHHRRLPARQARQGRRLRAHQAQAHAPGRVIDNTFRAGEKVELVDFEEKRMQFLYKDDRYNFMDLETYDQISLSADEVGDARDFLKENTEVEMLFIDGSPVTVELPELHRAPDRQDRSRHPRRHRLRRLQARHARDRRGDPGAALPQRGRRGEGRHAQRRLPRPRRGGGLADGRAKRRPPARRAPPGPPSESSSWCGAWRRDLTSWASRSRWSRRRADPRGPASTRPRWPSPRVARGARRRRPSGRGGRGRRRPDARHGRGAHGGHVLSRLRARRRRRSSQRGRRRQGRPGALHHRGDEADERDRVEDGGAHRPDPRRERASRSSTASRCS